MLRRLLPALLLLPACAASQPPPAPTLADRYATCSVEKSQSRPLIVEWPSVDRAALESLSKRGIVAVRYSGCEMEVLTRCQIAGEYRYTPVTLQSERITIRDADELFAKVPVGAAKLEGELERMGQLNVDTAIVGTYDAPSTVTRDQLEGSCEKATHVLTSLTVGAFEFYSGRALTAGGGADVLGIGAGAKTSSERTLLSRSGRGEACTDARGDDERPPEGCGSLLRVEATPIAPARAKLPPPPIDAPDAPDPEDPPHDPPPDTNTNTIDPNTNTPAPAPDPEPAPLPAAHTEPTSPGTLDTVGPPPPPRGTLHFGPGFVLGLRGPFATHFGKLEDGVSLHNYAPITAGAILEVGYRLSSMLTLVATGSLFGGSKASSNDECPTGVNCRAGLLGFGGDVVITPLGDERLWIGAGAEYSYVIARRTVDNDIADASTPNIETNRHYGGIAPRLSIGRDFVDAYVPWIQYGFMIAYSARIGLSASGTNTVDGVSVATNEPGLSHTIVFVGRFHFDLGVQRVE